MIHGLFSDYLLPNSGEIIDCDIQVKFTTNIAIFSPLQPEMISIHLPPHLNCIATLPCKLPPEKLELFNQSVYSFKKHSRRGEKGPYRALTIAQNT